MTTETTIAAISAANGSAFRDALKHDAQRLKGTIGERAKTEATARIDQASKVMGSASTAGDAAAEKLESNSDIWSAMRSIVWRSA